jgi:hypothetical protein
MTAQPESQEKTEQKISKDDERKIPKDELSDNEVDKVAGGSDTNPTESVSFNFGHVKQ